MTEADVGKYSCHATNEHGDAWQIINLLQAEPPTFTKRLQETTCLNQGSARMECKVIGIPTPTVKWFKDWQPLHESDRIKIIWEDPDTCTLFIHHTITRDAGLYSCTASNIAGSTSTSAKLVVEEEEIKYQYANYVPRTIKPRNRNLENYYDLGDELGRGTQGINYHAADKVTGNTYAAKVMHGKGQNQAFMKQELNIMNDLLHPRLVRLWDALQNKDFMALVTDLCGGGDLLGSMFKRDTVLESEIANYISQILEGLEYMHNRNIGHFGLTVSSRVVKIPLNVS